MIQYAKIIYCPKNPSRMRYLVGIVTEAVAKNTHFYASSVDECGEWLNRHYPNIEIR